MESPSPAPTPTEAGDSTSSFRFHDGQQANVFLPSAWFYRIRMVVDELLAKNPLVSLPIRARIFSS